MATFRPFRGLRYDATLVEMDDVIAPPYDIVDAAGRAELARRSPYNSILVELPEEDTAKGLDRYDNAASLLAQWQTKGVLRRESKDCFYGYRMDFAGEAGTSFHTTGVLGALGIAAEDRPGILPHEETMPKPKGDRLYLLRSTKTNVSPIWGLSPTRGLTGLCGDGSSRPDAVRATDGDGTVHTLWLIDDPSAVAAIAEAVGESPVVVADGHHRCETAMAFCAEQHEIKGSGYGDYDGVLAFVVELVPDELHVRPIHRVVSGLPAGFDLPGFVGRWYEMELLPVPAAEFASSGARSPSDSLGQAGTVALATRNGTWLLRDRHDSDAPANVLDELVTARLRRVLDDLPAHEIEYEPRWTAAVEALDTSNADAAFMVPPVTVDQIRRAASEHLRMPPKSTYFHPKPRTGMVFRPLDGCSDFLPDVPPS